MESKIKNLIQSLKEDIRRLNLLYEDPLSNPKIIGRQVSTLKSKVKSRLERLLNLGEGNIISVFYLLDGVRMQKNFVNVTKEDAKTILKLTSSYFDKKIEIIEVTEISTKPKVL